MSTYYEGVSVDREKYYIPQSFVLDYTRSGNSLTIYGLMSDNDPRVQENNVNSKTMLIRISDVMNPKQAYKNSDLNFNVAHSRYTYAGGPTLVIHKTADSVKFGDSITVGGASQPACKTVNSYSNVQKWADDITLFVECSVILNKPLIGGGSVELELDNGVKNSLDELGVQTCYVPQTSTLLSSNGAPYPVQCMWLSDADNKIKVYGFASTSSANPKVAVIVQAKISGKLSVKKVVAYAGGSSSNDGRGNKIVEASLNAGSNVVTTSSDIVLWSNNKFTFNANQGGGVIAKGNAGVASEFALVCTDGTKCSNEFSGEDGTPQTEQI